MLVETYCYMNSGRMGEGCGMAMWGAARTWTVNTYLVRLGHHAMIGQTHIQMASQWLHALLDSYTARI
jgi:hypothetical protein